MFGIILWTFVLIVWIGNIIIRTRPSMKNVEGNGFQILVAVMFIMLSVVNIVGRVISLNSDTSVESEIPVETTSSDVEFIQDEYYVTEEVY